MSAYFITATGTDIGKTYLTTLLCRSLKAAEKDVHALKPIISGWDENDPTNDTFEILRSLNLPINQENIENISPWRFKEPLSPDMAARMENRTINFAEVIEFCNTQKKHDFLLIEGVGGVMVPVTNQHTIADLIKEIDIKTIVVTGSYLGAISHTLTAINSLNNIGINQISIVINELEKEVDLDQMKTSLQNHTQHPIIILERKERYTLLENTIKEILA